MKRYGTVYKDLKQSSKHWYTIQYYPMFLVRRLIFILFLIFVTDYPEAQCNCFIVFTLFSFAYLVIAKPFIHTVDNLLFTINELSLLSISLLQIIFITGFKDRAIIENTGWVMIAL